MSERSEAAGFRAINRDTYDALIEAFRQHPGNAAAAGRAAGVTRQTATRAWRRGWPKRRWPAIKDVLAQEQRLARAARHQADAAALGLDTSIEATDPDAAAALAKAQAKGLHEAQRAALDAEQAAMDATLARAQEGQMVKLQRGNTIALMGSTSHLLRAGLAEARKLQEQLEAGEVVLTTQQRVRFVGSCGYLAKTAAEAAKLTMEMERLLLGAPTEIVGIQAGRLSMADAERVVDLAQRALQRVQGRGVVVGEARLVPPPPLPVGAEGEVGEPAASVGTAAEPAPSGAAPTEGDTEPTLH